MAMTLRLTDEEEKALISIKNSLGCTTLTGTIKSLISFHNELTKNFDDVAQAAQAAAAAAPAHATAHHRANGTLSQRARRQPRRRAR